MTKTQWLTGIKDTLLVPLIPSRLPLDDNNDPIVSMSYLQAHHEAGSNTDANGYVDMSTGIHTFSTNLEYLSGSLKVYINAEEVEFVETSPVSYNVPGNHAGHLTVSYFPKDPIIRHGNVDTVDQLEYTTRTNLRYVDIGLQMIEQIRYAINVIQKNSSIQQTRWCGGFYSDAFGLANYNEAEDLYYSNLRSLVTELTPQIIYEPINAIVDVASTLSVQLTDDYDVSKVYSKLGIEHTAIEFVRRAINRVEATIEI